MGRKGFPEIGRTVQPDNPGISDPDPAGLTSGVQRSSLAEFFNWVMPICFLSVLLYSCAKEPGNGLQLPPGWGKTGFGQYTLNNPEKQAEETVRILNDGLEPWRADAVNAASACLIDFGVVKDDNAASLSARLKTIEENSLYSFRQNSEQYEITVKFFDDIPVAVRMRIVYSPQ